MRVLAINSVIGAVFGAVFVIVNAGSLSTPVAVVLRVVAVAALVAVVLRGRGLRHDAADEGGRNPYGTAYRLVVAAELVALVAGIPIVHAEIGSKAIVGWIALVVGVHFFGLAAIWHRPRFAVLGVAVAGCGLAGLLLAAGSARTSLVAAVSGVVPGFVLLAFALQAVLTATPRTRAVR